MQKIKIKEYTHKKRKLYYEKLKEGKIISPIKDITLLYKDKQNHQQQKEGQQVPYYESKGQVGFLFAFATYEAAREFGAEATTHKTVSAVDSSGKQRRYRIVGYYISGSTITCAGDLRTVPI